MAVNMYVQFIPYTQGDTAGESESHAHVGHVEVTSFTHSFEQPTNPARSQSAVTIEKCTHNPIEFTRKIDISSMSIIKACWAGYIFKMVSFSAYRATGEESEPIKYLQIDLEHAVVNTYSVSGGEGDLPEETFALNYGIVSYTYFAGKKDSLKKGDTRVYTHNLITNTVS